MNKRCTNCGGTGECETELYEGLVTCWVCQMPETVVKLATDKSNRGCKLRLISEMEKNNADRTE